MSTQRTSFLVNADEAVSIKVAARLLNLSIDYLRSQKTRSRLGLEMVRNRANLDDRKIFLSRSSVLSAMVGRGIGDE